MGLGSNPDGNAQELQGRAKQSASLCLGFFCEMGLTQAPPPTVPMRANEALPTARSARGPGQGPVEAAMLQHHAHLVWPCVHPMKTAPAPCGMRALIPTQPPARSR